MAFDCVGKPVILQKPTRSIVKTGLSFPDQVIVTSTANSFVSPNHVKASDLLKDKEWVLLVKQQYRLDAEHSLDYDNITERDLVRADCLQKHLYGRFIRHVNEKVDEDKRKHWSMHFTAARLGVGSAIQVLLKHTKMDLSCLQNHECLFTPNLHLLFRLAKGLIEDGVYAYKDENNNRVVRVGMTMDRPFDVRDLEHWKAALLKTSEGMKSTFYKSYPREEAAHKVGSLRKGYRESLSQIVMLGHPLETPVDRLLKIYRVTDGDNENINKLNFKVKGKDGPSLADKQRKTIHCTIELICGLLMAPTNNVSSNPGFESALRQYGRE